VLGVECIIAGSTSPNAQATNLRRTIQHTAGKIGIDMEQGRLRRIGAAIVTGDALGVLLFVFSFALLAALTYSEVG